MNRQTGARRGREWAIQPNVQIVHSSDSFLISFICFSLSFTARHLPLTPRLGEGILLIWQGRRPFVDEDETTFLFFPLQVNMAPQRRWMTTHVKSCRRKLHFWQVVGSLSIAFLWLHHWRKLDTCRLSKALSMIRIVRSDDTGWSFFFDCQTIERAPSSPTETQTREIWRERERGGKGILRTMLLPGRSGRRYGNDAKAS